MSLVRRLISKFRKRSSSDRSLLSKLKLVVGYTPINLRVYQLALLHASAKSKRSDGVKVKESYERMEYLGDAILGAIVADYLFKRYPKKSEGFLTNIRSRIVSRDSLNTIARKIGIQNLILIDLIKNARMHKSIYGNTLEALIAAVYLDRGYTYCWKFVMKKVILPNVDIDNLIETDVNFKSKIIEWTQKHSKEIEFKTVDIEEMGQNLKQFTVDVVIDNTVISKGYGTTKKKAEQDAAAKACQSVDLE